MDKKYAITLLILAIFFLTTPFMGQSNDDGEHKKMGLDKEYNPNYKSFFRLITPYFAWNETLWVLLGFIIVGIITPTIIYFITQNWLSFFFYFGITNYFYAVMGAGLYPQAIATIFMLLLILFRKHVTLQAIVFSIGFFSHGFAPILLGVTWVLVALEVNWFKIKNGLLACSPIFGYKTPSFLQDTYLIHQEGDWGINLKELGGFLLKVCPFPFLFIALKEWFFNKNFGLILLCCFLFVAGFVTFNERAWFLIAPLMVIGFTNFFPNLVWRRGWLLLVLLFGLFHFAMFLSLNISC